MSYALLFSGQGQQHPAMLPWLDDGDGWRAGLADPVAATRNAFAQPMLTRLALAAWARLAALLPVPAAVAGYSVGELAAFSVAGAFDADSAVQLAGQRASLMDRCAADGPPTGLFAFSGLAPDLQAGLCRRPGLSIAIRTDSHTVVIGGPLDALALAADTATAAGAHVTPLRVALASHTPWMRGAAEAFAGVLQGTAVAAPRLPLFSNLTGGRLTAVADLRPALAGQIHRTVRWDEVMDGIAERGVSCVLELGGGSALARQWNNRFPAVPARAGDDFKSVPALVDWVNKAAGR